jgi:hypothetical protein
MIKNKSNLKMWLSVAAAIVAARGAQAYELKFGTNMPPVDFHGFLSQGLLYSSSYNYLGDTTAGSMRYTEAGLNASINPFARTHITAQGFLFDVGGAGDYKPFLDYASADYTFNDYLGLRGGRIRKPAGIYNSIQDIDLARTWVLLPQGIYDARFRDLSCSVDGGEAFGNLSLSKAGSLGYEIYGGYAHATPDSGLAKLIDNSLPGKITSFSDMPEVGYQLWWNTPVDGLRFGAALCDVTQFNYQFNVPTGFPPPHDKFSLLSASQITLQTYSAEYLWKNWTFQGEFYQVQVTGHVAGSRTYNSDNAWYLGASYRFNHWLETGGYYSEYYVNGAPAAGSVPSDKAQRDAALTVRFDPTSWWVIKVEGHYLCGTALLDNSSENPVRNSNGWFMLAVKSTFSF